LEYLDQKALKISGVEQKEMLESIKQQLIQAINDGKSFTDLKSEIDKLFDSAGVTKLSYKHIQLVFRMNTFAAYSIGQAQKVSDMIDRFPLAYFSSIHDNRSRHIRLEGYYKTDSVPLPPIDYNCRCGVRYIHVSQVSGKEIVFEFPPAPELIVFDQRSGM
jgi:uncharacterized protein with gpF-like domain